MDLLLAYILGGSAGGGITPAVETFIPNIQVVRQVQEHNFTRLGVTECGVIAAAAETTCLTITTDLGLYTALVSAGLDALNFSHVVDPL